MELTADFWNQRYKDQTTGWDIGQVSVPIKAYLDQLTDKSIKILIPGAGNSYEAEYAWSLGCKNIHVLDWSELAIENVRKRIPELPDSQLHQVDFFQFEDSFDLIIEQTFFCALDPSLREKYISKMAGLLSNDGILAGVMFNHPMFDNRPPYGGSIAVYRKLFEKHFTIKTLAPCYNSIEPRAGTECFIIATLKVIGE